MDAPIALDPAEYDRFWRGADDYIRYNPGSRHRRRQILKLLKGVPFESVLDVGCGNGAVLRLLGRTFPRARTLAGADFSPEAIARNRQALPGMTFHLLDIAREALPHRYDLVTCCEVIEHLTDRRVALANLAAMVRPGGHLLLTCPTGRVYATDSFFGHTTHPTAAELRGLAADNGLRVVRMRNWGFPMLRLFKGLTNVSPGWAFGRFASGAYSPAAKVAAEVMYGLNYLNLQTSSLGCQLFALLARPAY